VVTTNGKQIFKFAVEEEEEKEVEIVHDDYDDPVLASTPPSSGTNAVFPERSTKRSRRTFG